MAALALSALAIAAPARAQDGFYAGAGASFNGMASTRLCAASPALPTCSSARSWSPTGTIDAHTVNVTGAPYDFSSDDWVWGGAAQAGATYAFSPRWFLDLNYTVARSAEYDMRRASPTRAGATYLLVHQQITTQAVVLTLNRMF